MFKAWLVCSALWMTVSLNAETGPSVISGWSVQDSAKVIADGAAISQVGFHAEGWYPATVPGTILTTLVDNKVYPEPLYGENMRAIPESLNQTSYWYRARFAVPASDKGRHTWLHFAGVNYSAEIWVNGHPAGSMLGAFIRGDFDISAWVRPGRSATLAVLVHPQPHPGVPHEHTVALGVGKNGGESAIDGATFLATVGWDWLAAVRDRDTGIWLPVTESSTGPVTVDDTFVTSDLAASHGSADLTVQTSLRNLTDREVEGTLTGVISGHGGEIRFKQPMRLAASVTTPIKLDAATFARNCMLWLRSSGGLTGTASRICISSP